MDRAAQRFVANYFLRPPLLLIRFILRPLYWLYWLLYGWWGEKRFAVREQERLTGEIRGKFHFLFAEHMGIVIPSKDVGHLALLRCPIVTVAAEGLLFRFVHWRDSRQVHISSQHLPNEWHELAEVLNVIDPETVGRYSVASFEDAACLLMTYFHQIKEAFSSTHYSALKDQLDGAHRYDMGVTRQLQDEINRQLNPNK